MTLTLAVHPRATYRSDQPASLATPPLPGGVAAFRVSNTFERLAAQFAGNHSTEGTVLLHRDMWLDLGFPDQLTQGMSTGFLDPLRAVGWKCSETAYPTMSAWGHPTLPDVHFGPLHWIQERAKDYPLIDTTAHISHSLGLMSQWHQQTGCAYHGSPGMLATAILRHEAQRHAGTKREPTWHAKHPDVPYACERPYGFRHWTAPGVTSLTDLPLEMLDVNTAYCSTYLSVKVPRWSLQHRPATPFDPTRAGYWLLEDMPVWNLDWMPHPAGYGRSNWVTTPTMELFAQLAKLGLLAFPRVKESWTSHGYRELLPTGQLLAEMIYGEGIHPALSGTAKRASQIFHGQLVSPTGRVCRPDWHALVVAYFRAVLFLRTLRAGRSTEATRPVAFNVDAVYFRAGQLPGETHFPRTTSIGKFNPAKIRLIPEGIAA